MKETQVIAIDRVNDNITIYYYSSPNEGLLIKIVPGPGYAENRFKLDTFRQILKSFEKRYGPIKTLYGDNNEKR